MKNYLAHHGVAGQKWGQRHGPPYPLNSNPSKQAKLKAKSKSSYNKLYGGHTIKNPLDNLMINLISKTKSQKEPSKVDELKLKQQRYDKYTDEIYTEFSNTYKKKLKKLLDTPITIAKDQNLQRYSMHKKLSDEKWHSDYSYVSYTKRDDLAYKTSALANKLSGDVETKDVFRQSLKANRDLKIMPFSEVMTLIDGEQSLKSTQYKSYVLDKFASKSFIKKFVPVEDQEGYIDHLINLRGTKMNLMYQRYGEPEDGYDKLVDEASKRGYQGIVDVEDFLSPWFEKPIILFNPSDNIRDVSSTIIKKASDKPIYDEYSSRMMDYYETGRIGNDKLGKSGV